MFPPERRGRALSTYLIGASIGTALSSIIPGSIVGANLHLSIPGYGLVIPWRSAFILCGAIGPIVGLLFFSVKEPARRGMQTDKMKGPTAVDKLAYLWRQRAVVIPLFLGFCLYYVAFVGVAAWTAPLLMRSFDAQLPDFANTLGIILLISGVSGYMLGGLSADSAIGSRRGGRLMIMTILPIIALPSAFSGFAPSLLLAILLLASITLATPMLNVAMNATVQEIVPNDMRGFSYAFLSVVSALPAGAGGPLLLAWVTQSVLGDPARIATSFVIVVIPSLLGSAIAFLLARRAYLRVGSDGELGNVIAASRN
jgi:MFS family permease